MDLKNAVQNKYGRLIQERVQSCCCSCSCGVSPQDSVPSFGVGRPIEFAGIKEGERVLDVGCGAGGNCILAARLVGQSGKVVGLDLTREMIEAAQDNAREAGVTGVSFVQGDAENMPFGNAQFDVVISDCVINLAPDKERVFREIYRVLGKGGRAIISDVVSEKVFPKELQQDEDLWCGCVSGALPEDQYVRCMHEAGFERVEILEEREGSTVAGIRLFHATFRAVKNHD